MCGDDGTCDARRRSRHVAGDLTATRATTSVARGVARRRRRHAGQRQAAGGRLRLAGAHSPRRPRPRPADHPPWENNPPPRAAPAVRCLRRPCAAVMCDSRASSCVSDTSAGGAYGAAATRWARSADNNCRQTPLNGHGDHLYRTQSDDEHCAARRGALGAATPAQRTAAKTAILPQPNRCATNVHRAETKRLHTHTQAPPSRRTPDRRTPRQAMRVTLRAAAQAARDPL